MQTAARLIDTLVPDRREAAVLVLHGGASLAGIAAGDRFAVV